MLGEPGAHDKTLRSFSTTNAPLLLCLSMPSAVQVEDRFNVVYGETCTVGVLASPCGWYYCVSDRLPIHCCSATVLYAAFTMISIADAFILCSCAVSAAADVVRAAAVPPERGGRRREQEDGCDDELRRRQLGICVMRLEAEVACACPWLRVLGKRGRGWRERDEQERHAVARAGRV